MQLAKPLESLGLQSSPSPERELSPPPIEVIFELEFYTRHSSTPQLPVSETTITSPGFLPFCLLWSPASNMQLQVPSMQ
jgi:hypothetical protein